MSSPHWPLSPLLPEAVLEGRGHIEEQSYDLLSDSLVERSNL